MRTRYVNDCGFILPFEVRIHVHKIFDKDLLYAIPDNDILRPAMSALKFEVKQWFEEHLGKMWYARIDFEFTMENDVSLIVRFSREDVALLFKLTWV
jgi:hypothetical protein